MFVLVFLRHGPRTRGAPFAKAQDRSLRLVVWLLGRGVQKRARALRVSHSFLFMKANGAPLGQLAKLIEAGAIRPVVDRVYPFAQAPEALAHVETGRAKGKVVVSPPG
jgi:NADPH:quinone reductase-like Zn-dependent oxidoreductase